MFEQIWFYNIVEILYHPFFLYFFINAFFLWQEYSEESNSEPDVDLENQYYNSKALKEDDPRSALESFQKVSVCLSV